MNTLSQDFGSRLMAGETQEIIVEFNADDVETEAAAIRGQKGLIYDDRDIGEFKSQRFRQIKNRVLSGFSGTDADLLIEYSHLPMALLRIRSWQAFVRILDLSEIVAVHENRKIYPYLAQSLPLINQPPAISAGHTGAGTTVAVIDTGVNYVHADFGPCVQPGVPSGCKVVAAIEIATNDNSLDDIGHGTGVSAIVINTAPQSKIVSLDVFNPSGTSTDALVISGINWAIANRSAYNIVAMNMSLGDGSAYISPCSDLLTNPYLTPVNNARSAGIVPVAASGNNGYTGGISRPACTPGVVSVGAVYDANIGGVSYSACMDSTTAADKVTCFSNSAVFLTMLAPGAAITWRGTTMYGTSHAAPHVAGAVAVLKAVYPVESNDAIIWRLVASGQKIIDARSGTTFPRLNLAAAIEIQPADAPALSVPGQWGVMLLLLLLGSIVIRKHFGNN